MELRCNLGGTGCGCDVTWIKVRYKYQDLYWCEIRPGWIWDVHLRDLEGNEMGHKLGWALHLQTRMGARWYLDEIDLQIYRDWWKRPGRRWDINVDSRMELRCEPSDPDGGQTVHGRKWCKYIGIWIQMRQDLHGVETYLETWVSLRWWLLESEMQFCGRGWRWDVHL